MKIRIANTVKVKVRKPRQKYRKKEKYTFEISKFRCSARTTVEPRSCESEGTDCFFLKSEFFSGVR